MPTPDQIRAAAAGYASTDEAAAKRLRDAQALVFGQAAQQVGSVRQAQVAAPQLVQAAAEPALKQAEQSSQTQIAAGQQANELQNQANQSELQAAGTAQGLKQTQDAGAQQVAEAQTEANQRVQMTMDEQSSANRIQAVGLDYDNKLSFMSRKQRDDLAKLGRDVKDELFTSRLTFDKDESGRKFSNERQLADYTVANAKSIDDLKDKAQKIQQAHDREQYMERRAYEVLGQKLQEQFQQAEQERNQDSMAKIARLQAQLKKDQAESERKAAAQGNIISGVVGGAAAGSAFGPYGAVIGAVAGGGSAAVASQ